jgi:AcrR family transcriptional regulator
LILRAQGTREVLLKTAVSLFSRKGYLNTSIREIGAKAGVSDSIIYHYFKNKEELLFEIIRIASQDLMEMLLKIEKSLPDPLECLHEMLMVNMIIFNLKRKEEIKIITSERYWLRSRQQREVIRNVLREIRNIYAKKIKQIGDRGLLNDIDLSVLNSCISNIVVGFHEWYREGGRLTGEEAAQNIIKFVYNAILNKKGLYLASRSNLQMKFKFED